MSSSDITNCLKELIVSDPRERWNDQEGALKVALDRKLGTVWTMLPVLITEDSEGHVCAAKSAIKGQGQGEDGSIQDVEMTPLGKTIPVHFTSGGGFTITHPIKKDDEGLMIFSSRSIDGWHKKGDVQEQVNPRRHDLSDGFYIPGIRSDPRKLGGNGNGAGDGLGREQQKTKPPSTNSIQIRTDSGDYYIELTDKDVNVVCVNCTVKAEEKVTITCKNMEITAEQDIKVKCANMEITADKVKIDSPRVEMTGDLDVRGTVKAQGEVIGRNIRLSSHIHSGVQGGMGVSGPPKPG